MSANYNKIIIVSGSASYIGSYLCQKLLDSGHRLICFSRSRSKLDGLKKKLVGVTDENLAPYVLDINKEREVKKIFKKISQKFGTVDALVNAAAKEAEERDFDKVDQKYWRDMMEVNVATPFLLSREAAKIMPKYGSIINIGSIYGVTPTDMSIYEEGSKRLGYNTVYGTSKGALLHLTRHLAKIYAPRQIRVNCVSFGGLRRNQDKVFIKRYSSKVPMDRMAELDDCDGVVSFLVSDKSRYITGQNIMVDGGWSL